MSEIYQVIIFNLIKDLSKIDIKIKLKNAIINIYQKTLIKECIDGFNNENI